MNVDLKEKIVWNSTPTMDLKEGVSRTSLIIKSASSASHLGGIPRRVVLTTVGAFARLFTSLLNRTSVYNMDTLLDLVQSRPLGTPLVTFSNHMSTLDDPLMWGVKGLPITDPELCRWTLTAEDICFTNPLYSYLFRLGKCLPITRGAGIYQPYMGEALDVINRGEWLHTFPEGKLCQEEGPIKRLKWGVASLIARADVQPIVLPIAHSGFEKMIPENFWFGGRPPLPLMMKRISIVVGEPMVFDIPQLKRTAKAMTVKPMATNAFCKLPIGSDLISGSNICSLSTNTLADSGGRCEAMKQRFADEPPIVLDECELSWMYSHMSENLRCILQDLALKAKSINKIQG